jgi:MFS family permease
MTKQSIQQSPGTKPGFFYGYIVVLAALSIMVVSWGTYYAFGVFFKPVLVDFGWTSTMTAGAFSLSLVMNGLLGIVMGGLSDRFGPRIVISLSGLLFGFGYLLMSQVSTIWQLYLFYGLIIGTAMSGTFPPLSSTIARWFVKRRGMMTGILVAGIGIGTLLGSPIANWLVTGYGWQISYLILGSVVLVVIVSAAQFLKSDPTQAGQAAYGAVEVEKQRLRLRGSGLSLGEVIYTRQFWMVLPMILLYGSSVFTIIVHIVPHATEMGSSAASAANVLATIGMLSILGKLVLGSAIDRIGSRQGFIIGLTIMALGLFWLVSATKEWTFYLFAALFGFAYGGCSASVAPLTAWLFGLRSLGLMVGIINAGLTIGGAAGSLVAGNIFDATSRYQIAFLISASVTTISLVLIILLKPIQESRNQS